MVQEIMGCVEEHMGKPQNELRYILCNLKRYKEKRMRAIQQECSYATEMECACE